MERSEPSLVPEWLRGNGGGGLSHHFAASQADRSSSNNARRSFSSNGSCIKHDKNPSSRSYSSFTRNQSSKDFDKSDVADSWDSEYSGSLTNFAGRRLENGTLERSKSMNSRRDVEFSQRRAFSDLRNRSNDIKSNGNGAVSVDCRSTGSQRVSFERDFPVLGYDGRPMSPDIVRVPSPGLNKGVQGLSIGTSPLLGRDGRTSVLAEVPVETRGSDSVGSSHRQQQPSDAACDPPTPVSVSISSTSNGLKVAEALVQAPARSHSGPQAQRFEELACMGTKKLIPMIPLMPKTIVPNPSDKLKPKTAAKPIDVAVPKNGLQQMPSSQLRSGSGPTNGPKSSSGMLLLKPGRGKGGSAALQDIAGTVANGPSPGVPSLSSAPFRNSNSVKHPVTDRRTAAYSSNLVPVVDKRVSLAQLRSRNDFLNLIRKKSTVSTSSVDNDVVVSSESEVAAPGPTRPTENCEVNCNGDASKLAQNCSDQRGNTVTQYEVIHPEEELELLKQMGWNGDAGDDEGLTEEEINAFVQKYMTSKHAPKLLRGLQIQMTAGPSSPGLSTSSI